MIALKNTFKERQADWNFIEQATNKSADSGVWTIEFCLKVCNSMNRSEENVFCTAHCLSGTWAMLFCWWCSCSVQTLGSTTISLQQKAENLLFNNMLFFSVNQPDSDTTVNQHFMPNDAAGTLEQSSHMKLLRGHDSWRLCLVELLWISGER